MLDNMQRRGVVEESDTTWSSPVFVVRKKIGELRFCVGYKKSNDVRKSLFH
jgi:hypothetical protein